MIEVGLSDNLKIVLLEFLSNFGKFNVSLIKSVTISDDLIDICMELRRRRILPCLEVVLNL